jgi:hypothetical protein
MAAPVGPIGALAPATFASQPRRVPPRCLALRSPYFCGTRAGPPLPSGPNRGTRQQRSRDRVRRGPAPPGGARPRHAAPRHQRCRARRRPPTHAATGTSRRAARVPAAHTAAHARPGEAAAAHRGASPPPVQSAPSRRSPASAQGARTDRASSRARGEPRSHGRSSAMRAAGGGRTCVAAVAAGEVAAAWGAIAGAACSANKWRQCITPCTLAGMGRRGRRLPSTPLPHAAIADLRHAIAAHYECEHRTDNARVRHTRALSSAARPHYLCDACAAHARARRCDVVLNRRSGIRACPPPRARTCGGRHLAPSHPGKHARDLRKQPHSLSRIVAARRRRGAGARLHQLVREPVTCSRSPRDGTLALVYGISNHDTNGTLAHPSRHTSRSRLAARTVARSPNMRPTPANARMRATHISTFRTQQPIPTK